MLFNISCGYLVDQLIIIRNNWLYTILTIIWSLYSLNINFLYYSGYCKISIKIGSSILLGYKRFDEMEKGILFVKLIRL